MPEYDGRFEVEIVYKVTISSIGLVHHHTFDVKLTEDPAPGESWDNIGLYEKSGLIVDMPTFIQDYMDVWSALMGTATSLEEIILWRYDDEPATSKVYIS